MNSPARKVGRITVALGMMAVGASLLMDNLLGSGPSYTSLIIRFWPVLLIGFGLEYLLFSMLDRQDGPDRRRLRFDFGGAILLMIVVGLTAGYSTVTQWISLNPQDYVVVADATDRTESRSVSAEGAKELLVSVDVGRVVLASQDAPEVRVEAAYGMQGVLQLREQAEAVGQFGFEIEEGEVIKVTGRAPKGINIGGLSAIYRIYAPANLKVKIESNAGAISVQDYEGELDLSTKVGSVAVEAASGSLKAQTSSGTVRVESFDGPVAASTNAGSIMLYRVSGALELDSGTGVIAVEEFGGGTLRAETRTGSIDVETSQPPAGEVLLRTSTGRIELNLPEEADIKLTASTRTGSIDAPDGASVSQSGPSRSATWTLGKGTHPVTLEANMGSISFDAN